MSDTVTAVKADPSTGTAATLDPITVSVIGRPPRLTISDEGDGLPSADVFDRGSSSGGSGLGLDIVRRVAEASGGGITLGEGAGATIVVRFGEPVSPTEAN